MLEIDARSYISEIRNGLTVGNDNNVLYLPRTVAPNYATLQACLPCCLGFLLHKFIQRLLRCTATTTGNVHCIPCRLTGRKMRGKTFAQWFCKSAMKKVHKLSTTHFDSSIPGQKLVVVKLVYKVVRGPRSKQTTLLPFPHLSPSFGLAPSMFCFLKDQTYIACCWPVSTLQGGANAGLWNSLKGVSVLGFEW